MEHFLDCHSTKDNMVPEAFFPDPFVKGGWFLFRLSDRLFQWQSVHITTQGQEPASRHSSRLKALLWIEEEIQKRLAPKENDQWAVDGKAWTAQFETDPEPPSQTLKRLTYDWEPLNRALEQA
jgi:hypothetical protein